MNQHVDNYWMRATIDRSYRINELAVKGRGYVIDAANKTNFVINVYYRTGKQQKGIIRYEGAPLNKDPISAPVTPFTPMTRYDTLVPGILLMEK